MPCLRLRLDEWRAAERRRDGTTPGTPARLAAEEDVRRARSRYHNEAAAVLAQLPSGEILGSTGAADPPTPPGLGDREPPPVGFMALTRAKLSR